MKNIKSNVVLISFIVLMVGALSACSRNDVTPSPVAKATRDPKIEATAVAQLESINPAAVPIYKDATSIGDSGNFEKSKQLYQQVLSMAPNFATAYRRLGYLALNANDIDGAITLLRKAGELEPDAYNQSALAVALIQKQTSVSNHEAFQLASSAAKLLPDDESVIQTWLLAATSIDDYDTLRLADEKLLQIAPNNPIAHYYAGGLAAMDGKWEKAEKELLISKQLGIPADVVQKGLDAGIARNAMVIRLIRWSIIALAAWALGLVALFLTGTILSRATLKALSGAQPNLNTQITPRERKVRSIYRGVITVLSLYFYVSIPFEIVLLLLVVGGVLYIFYTIGSIPYYVIGILVVIVFGSLFAIIRSIFSRVNVQLPGRSLNRMDAPELWRLVEDVAHRLGVAAVDSIHLTPDVGIGVNEQGNIFKKIRGSGKRNLLLGMGALGGLTRGQFAGILAHEYGHFSNRDTAGGNLAHQVQASFNGMAVRMIKTGVARFYNPVWLFLVGYQRIFLRVTLGASRLQEILADRFAAVSYGSENFIEGLKKYIRQTIAFPIQANSEIHDALEMQRAIVNLYDVPLQDKQSNAVWLEFDKVMARTTSTYDSHPSPKDRISYIEKLNVPYSPVHDNPRPVLDLFPNPEALQREMTAEITKHIRK